MERGLTVAVAAVAILVVGVSGCSSNTSGSSKTSGATTSAGGGGASGTKVIIDGKDQKLSGASVHCTDLVGTINIAIGGSGFGGINALVTDANPPEVKQVGLSNVGGLELGYNSATDPGKASATKNGSSYKITGTATGLDEGVLRQVPFEINATCP